MTAGVVKGMNLSRFVAGDEVGLVAQAIFILVSGRRHLVSAAGDLPDAAPERVLLLSGEGRVVVAGGIDAQPIGRKIHVHVMAKERRTI